MNALTLWFTDLVVVFLNGAIKGIPAGGLTGGAAAASTDSTNPQTLALNAALGILLGMGGNGLKSVVVWHDAHPLPNPFRHEKAVTPPASLAP
jgi:hypothetical protein